MPRDNRTSIFPWQFVGPCTSPNLGLAHYLSIHRPRPADPAPPNSRTTLDSSGFTSSLLPLPPPIPLLPCFSILHHLLTYLFYHFASLSPYLRIGTFLPPCFPVSTLISPSSLYLSSALPRFLASCQPRPSHLTQALSTSSPSKFSLTPVHAVSSFRCEIFERRCSRKRYESPLKLRPDI